MFDSQESGVSVAAATTSVSCPHGHSVVCTVWCLVQNYKGKYCSSTATTTSTTTTTTTTLRPVAVDFPDCPAEYHGTSTAAVLCVMWVELSELEQSVGTIPQSGLGYIPVTCQFRDHESMLSIHSTQS